MRKDFFQIRSLHQRDDFSAWKEKTPLERLEELEELRMTFFGYDPTAERLQRVLGLLDSKQIEYLVVGGYAVAFHGYPRATGDIDIWVAVHKENAAKLTSALKEFGFNVPELREEIFLEKEKNIRMGVPPLRIEILTTIDGVEFKECYRNKKSIVVDGVEVNFISLEDLKKNKKASGRHKDLDDLEHFEQKKE